MRYAAEELYDDFLVCADLPVYVFAEAACVREVEDYVVVGGGRTEGAVGVEFCGVDGVEYGDGRCEGFQVGEEGGGLGVSGEVVSKV